MSVNQSTFETLIPSRYITFTLPNTSPNNHLHTNLLRISVLDSPIQSSSSSNLPSIAAMIVPNGRESDWIFSTKQGHLQNLSVYPQFSRLVLIGNDSVYTSPTDYVRSSVQIDSDEMIALERSLSPLVMSVCPKSAFVNGLPHLTFLTYEDEIVCSLVVDMCVGKLVGEMLIEDVLVDVSETVSGGSRREFRRRLRFKRTPNMVQTQLPVVGGTRIDDVSLLELRRIKFCPDTGVLVQPYLTPMVAGLSLIAPYLDERTQLGFCPRALCVGVGGGALVSFLNDCLGFEVVGVEMDPVVLKVASKYFGLKDSDSVRLIVGDGIKLIEKLACRGDKQDVEGLDDFREMKGRHLTKVEGLGNKFDVIMVDLDSCDARLSLTAPPIEFVKKSVLQAAKSVLCEGGILVINVLPPDQSFYVTLTKELMEVFSELYEIDVEDEDNFVTIATASSIVAGAVTNDCENCFLTKLRSCGGYLESIVKT